ncbi:DUF6011 domain-containing protein [Streptomyces wedmorensis]|uniref:DUF6011 domain-containing protein n=1 Tax=Streptomyces wedmorensis TaxID=43759 RepID=UPI0034355709
MPFGRFSETEFGVPKAVIELVADGYYAVRVEPDQDDWTFLRVSRPESGPRKGHFKVQTQHGDNLKEVFAISPSGEFLVASGDIRLMIIELATGQHKAAANYGRKVGKCCRCGKTLTDNVSRKYGIGPECIQMWPDIKELVDAELAEAEDEEGDDDDFTT